MTDDEFDEWVSESLESVPKKLGLCPRTTWMHPMNLQHPIDGEHVRKYPKIFFQYFRLSVSTFDYILNTIELDITEHSIGNLFYQERDWL